MDEFTLVNLLILGLCIICLRIYHAYEKIGHSCTLAIIAVIWAFWVTIGNIVKTTML